LGNGARSAPASEKGLDDSVRVSDEIGEYKNRQYNLLARALREHLDFERIYRIMGVKR
jgi:cobyric acid synthase